MSRNGMSPMQRAEARTKSAGYEFTGLWFYKTAAKVFRRRLGKLALLPVSYVEVGVYEGCSACWVCENILKHPGSRGWGIDSWIHPAREGTWDRWGDDQMALAKARAYRNLARFASKFTIVEGDSPSALRSGFVPDGSVDLVYLDGSHFPDGVRADALAAWPLLKPGGVMVFDDCNRPEVMETVLGLVARLGAGIEFDERTHMALRKGAAA